VLCFGVPPREGALWHLRSPETPEFTGDLPPVLAEARTIHWFDPRTLLVPDARSEYRPEHRERQEGGGWKQKACVVSSSVSDDGLRPAVLAPGASKRTL